MQEDATLAESVDAVDSKSTVRKGIPVQVREVVPQVKIGLSYPVFGKSQSSFSQDNALLSKYSATPTIGNHLCSI